MKAHDIDLANIATIMGKEMRDSRRNRWFILISIIFTGLSLGLSLFSFAGIGSFGIPGFGRTTASLLNLVLFIVPLMGLLLGATSIAGEKESGTLNTLLAQPVSASEVMAGKFVGMAASLTAALFFGFGLSGLILGLRGGVDHLDVYALLVGYTILLGLIFLGIGFLVSVFSMRSTSAIGVAIFLWFVFIFGSDLGMMGTGIVLRLSGAQLFWMVILNPVQSFKMAVMGLLQGDLDMLGPTGGYAMELFGEGYLFILNAILLLWIVLSTAASLWFFRKRCAQ